MVANERNIAAATVVTAVGGTLKIAANTVTDGKLVVVAECKEVAIDGAAPPSDVAFVLANGTIDSIHKGVPPGTSVARTGDKGGGAIAGPSGWIDETNPSAPVSIVSPGELCPPRVVT